MDNYALDISNLNLTQDKFKLVDVNFKIEKGTIMGFIGRNGAGKTTTINAIMSFIRKDSGKILFDGKPMYGNEVEVKNKIGYINDTTNLPNHYTIKKCIKILPHLFDTFDIEIFKKLCKELELNDDKLTVAKYSLGNRKKLNIATALARNVDILILDEPLANLDPIARNQIIDLLMDYMQDENHSILISSHILTDLDKICDNITLIDQGKIKFSMGKDIMLDQYRIVNIPTNIFKAEFKEHIIGYHTTSLGIKGLTTDVDYFNSIAQISTELATTEDIMLYYCEKNND